MHRVGIVAGLKLAQLVAVEHVKLALFARGDQQVRMRTGLIGQQDRTAGPEIVVVRVELLLIRGREVVGEFQLAAF